MHEVFFSFGTGKVSSARELNVLLKKCEDSITVFSLALRWNFSPFWKRYFKIPSLTQQS